MYSFADQGHLLHPREQRARFKNIIHVFDQACFLLLRQKYIMILESFLTNGNAVFHY
jgi:hypothetical protein